MDISNTSLQAILENSPTGYVLTNQEDEILWINNTFTRIFGYSFEECLHKKLVDLITPDVSQCKLSGMETTFSADDTGSVQETTRLQKDGRPVHVAIFATPIYDENGVCHTCYNYTDITHRVKAQSHASVLHEISHAINSSQNLKELYISIHISLGKIIDTTNFFIALYDKKSDIIRFVYYTDVAEEVGKEIDVIEQASQVKGSYTARVIFEGKPVLLTAEQIKKDYNSENKPVGPITRSWLGVPLSIKKDIIGAVAVQNYVVPDVYDENDIEILQSITEQIAIAIETKRTEQELIESEYLHKSLFNQGVDAILVHDLSGKILKVNDVAKARFGYSEMELLTMSMEDICESLPTMAKGNTDSDEISSTSETIQLTKSGQKIVSELYRKHIFYNGQKAIICSALDITEKKAREERQHALEKRLNQAQTMQALGQLAGGVAHDLNNILSGISSYPELILLKLSEDSPLRTPLETIKKAGFKAAEIVDDMLAFTRLGKGSESVINLNSSIQKFLVSPEYLKLKVENIGVQVMTACEDTLLNIEGSEVHLSKVFLNLVKNGFKAIATSGKVTIETDNIYISSQMGKHDYIPEGEYVTLRFSDSGIGIPEDDIARIFEPFYTTKKIGHSGAGLGMAIVWKTVKDYNGYIDIKSSKESGTTFTLYFPASRKELTGKQTHTSLADYSGKGELIYVVDDVFEQRIIASGLLEALGYRVITFESGEDVLTFLKVKKEFPVLFILDMIMEPGIDGAETFNNICKIAPNQKALIASGFSEIKQVKAASKIGAGQYLRKPYTLENLAEVVKKVINRT